MVRISLPEPVSLKRLAVALWVLIFGTFEHLHKECSLFWLFGRQHHQHGVPFHLWALLYDSDIGQILGNTNEQVIRDFLVCDFASTEAYAHTHLGAMSQKIRSLIDFRLNIVI